MPLISVILPFFSAEETIPRAIDSIRCQTYPNWELILVDNLSTPASVEIAQRYTQLDDRILLIQCLNKGVANAFNKGLSVAKGEFIARMDADDFSYPQRLASQWNLLKSNNTIDAVGGLVKYQSSLPQAGMAQFVGWSNQSISPEQIALNRFVELPTINPTLMFRRSSLEQYGSYRHTIHRKTGLSQDLFPEDYELVLRWLAAGAAFAKVDEVLLDWYDLPQRLTRTDPRYSSDAFYQIKSKYLAEWLASTNPFHPEIMVWGAGRKSRKRARMLERHNISVRGYIDIVPHKTTHKPCVYYQDIAPPGQYFVVSYVANRGQREKIRQFLLSRHYKEGEHFILAA